MQGMVSLSRSRTVHCSRPLLPEHVWAGPQHPPASVPDPFHPFLPGDFVCGHKADPQSWVCSLQHAESLTLICQPKTLTADHHQHPTSTGLVPQPVPRGTTLL